MRDLGIYGKNRLLGLFRAWLKKQMEVQARAGPEGGGQGGLKWNVMLHNVIRRFV
jgi:hypothetical protein